jgi:hypothetical protein
MTAGELRAGAPFRSGVALFLWVMACGTEHVPRLADSTPVPPPAQLVDSTVPPAIAGTGGWNYQQRATSDLDGDGAAEQVVLTARVELSRGRPAWDDGQPWQVYIEERDSTRTYVYAQFVQLGTVTMRIGEASDGKRASIVLIEHLPDRIGLYEVDYEGPGRASLVQRFERTLDPRGDIASPRLP